MHVAVVHDGSHCPGESQKRGELLLVRRHEAAEIEFEAEAAAKTMTSTPMARASLAMRTMSASVKSK